MWRYYFNRAVELQDERIREALPDRPAARVRSRGSRLVIRVRRRGALAAASLAKLLDACAAREALAGPEADATL